MSLPISFNFSPALAVGYFQSLKRQTRGANTRAMKRGWEDAGTAYLQFLRRRYQRAASGGGPWRKLKPATVLAKGGDARIKRRTDRLFMSLYRGNPECVFAVDATGLTIGTMVPYAGFHETGNARLPKRATYIRPDPGTRQIMKAKLDTAVYAAVREAVASVRSISPRPAA